MSKLKELHSIEFDYNENKVFGIKSAILWGHGNDGKSFPLVYITKPKHITDEEYKQILYRLLISMKA